MPVKSSSSSVAPARPSRGAIGFSLFAWGWLLGTPALAQTFDFEQVAAQARALAAEPYVEARSPLPDELLKIDYDHYRDIRFRPARALWRDAQLPFEVMFFHPGLYFDHPVRIHEVTDKGAHEIPFDAADFDYGANRFDPQRLRGIGYAGFRVHYPINGPQYKDEVLVFLGASYFRALGRNQVYGLSARGLAIDTAQPTGEEFPRFEQFWLPRPQADAKSLEIYALLNSRRITGAYRFVLTPGTDTLLEVSARLYARESSVRVGLAPLTSMFFFGENQRAVAEDYRPEVHDSDGLQIAAASGEWIWRPLTNPRRVMVSSFAQVSPRGFGLMQRDRRFTDYEDLEAHYERRPSAWVEPIGGWGAGRVELVQFPAADETHDNIVAYWVPDVLPAPGTPIEFAYRLHWQKETEVQPPGAWVTQSRRGEGYVKQRDSNSLHFVVDFEGPALRALPPDASVTGEVSVGPYAQLLETDAYRNTVSGGWRLMLRVKRSNPNLPVELRAFLRSGTSALSETWSYLLPPD
jgi:glucans biosynthesis protein